MNDTAKNDTVTADRTEIDGTIFNPYSHLRLRKLTMPAFSKPVMGKIDARIRDLIVTCFDEIGTPEQFDAFSMIAEKLPVRSIARMVGVPTNRESFFHDFAVNVVQATRTNLPPRQREQAMQDPLPGFQYFLDIIKQRRAAAHPGDDFIGSLVSASEDGDKLTDDPIVSVIQAVIAAGTAFEDLPEDWMCPECGSPKSAFERDEP